MFPSPLCWGSVILKAWSGLIFLALQITSAAPGWALINEHTSGPCGMLQKYFKECQRGNISESKACFQKFGPYGWGWFIYLFCILMFQIRFKEEKREILCANKQFQIILAQNDTLILSLFFLRSKWYFMIIKFSVRITKKKKKTAFSLT